MTKFIKLLSTAIVLSVTSLACVASDNTLSETEQKDGWQLLFNGNDMSQWRNFKQQTLNKNWQVVDGEMRLTGKGGGDIVTKATYKNFELSLQWKISPAGNSGIFIMADEHGRHIYSHAIEVQILDNERHSDNKLSSHLSGSLYDLFASSKNSQKVAGQWNDVRIIVLNKRLRVWQNKVQTVDVTLGSDKWQQALATSKFATWQGFASNDNGHIGLQDHGDAVAFKNIKIKAL